MIDLNAKKRIAILIAIPAVSTTTGWPVGFWWSELSHPYLVFTEAGYAVEGKIFMPVCGNDADAKNKVMALATLVGFDAVDLGDLTSARYLGPLV